MAVAVEWQPKGRDMNLQAWASQRAAYSRARRGRNERGASLAECALVQGVTEAMALRQRVRGRPSVGGGRREALPAA